MAKVIGVGGVLIKSRDLCSRRSRRTPITSSPPPRHSFNRTLLDHRFAHEPVLDVMSVLTGARLKQAIRGG